MLELINLANDPFTEKTLRENPQLLENVLKEYQLDGLEIIFCEPWDSEIFPQKWIQGSHLIFWNDWLDFWKQNTPYLRERYRSDSEINSYFGATNPQEWLNFFRKNIQTSTLAGAKYLVFHVSQARPNEVFSWDFHYSDEDIIDATIEMVNELVAEIPQDTFLLFENLWWPGLTFQNSKLAEKLLSGVKHSKSGFMLDTGHLMNCNPNLTNEDDGIEYILDTLEQLGDLKDKIVGLHLHQSLSGEYQKISRRNFEKPSFQEIYSHVSQIDQHKPFKTNRVLEIIEEIQPLFLVHELGAAKLTEPEWIHALKKQQNILQKKD